MTGNFDETWQKLLRMSSQPTRSCRIDCFHAPRFVFPQIIAVTYQSLQVTDKYANMLSVLTCREPYLWPQLCGFRGQLDFEIRFQIFLWNWAITYCCRMLCNPTPAFDLVHCVVTMTILLMEPSVNRESMLSSFLQRGIKQKFIHGETMKRGVVVELWSLGICWQVQPAPPLLPSKEALVQRRRNRSCTFGLVCSFIWFTCFSGTPFASHSLSASWTWRTHYFPSVQIV